MDIGDILTEIEYTKERSAKELFAFVEQKEIELKAWGQQHPDRKKKRQILSKGLPDKFVTELTPFAYYANTYYGNKPEVRFKPCCGSGPCDGIIVDNNKEIFVEITEGIDGTKWGNQKKDIVEKGWSFSDGDDICKTKQLVKNSASEKCKKSMEQELRYGQEKTILMVIFDDKNFRENDRNDFVKFKQTEIDSMEHNFIKIILFGWASKKFIIENH